MFGQLLAAVQSGTPRERATAIAILVSTTAAVFLLVGTLAAIVAVFRGIASNGLLLGLVAFALCWMAFVLLGDVVLAKIFESS